MATATGNEQIVNVINASATSAGGTLYTVPNGRYALVTVLELNDASSGSTVNFNNSALSLSASESVGMVSGALGIAAGSANSVQTINSDVLLLAGQTINVSAGSVDYDFNIREFKAP